MTVVGYGSALTGQRIVDATPLATVDDLPPGDEHVADADRLDELASASIRASLATMLVDGPQVLYRFCHGADARVLEDGVASWWTAEDPFGDALVAGRRAAVERRQWVFQDVMQQHRLARAIDWHRDAYVRSLRVPQGVSLRVLAHEVGTQARDPGRSRDAVASSPGSGAGGRLAGAPEARHDRVRAGYAGWRRSVQYVLVLSQVVAQGLYPSEPVPLVSFLASHR